MKKISYLIIALLIVAAPSQAQLLWKISGKGLAHPSYMFGSHHLAKLSIIDSIKGLKPAFESTKQVVGEIDMKDMSLGNFILRLYSMPLALSVKMMQRMWYKTPLLNYGKEKMKLQAKSISELSFSAQLIPIPLIF